MLQYIIVIIIFLVLLNITSYILYKPPCNSIDDYFILAKKIPNFKVNSLKSIQDIDYKMKYKPSSISNSNNNNTLSDVINKMFPLRNINNDGTNKKDISNYDGTNIAMFEVEMEGVIVNNSHRNNNSNSVKPSGHIYKVERDGYKDRSSNIW